MKQVDLTQTRFDYDVDSGMWLITEGKEVIGAFSAREQAEEFINTLRLWDAQTKAKMI